MQTPRLVAFSALVCFALLACGRSEQKSTSSQPAPTPPPVASAAPFRVGSLDLGREVGPDKRITAPTTAFAPTDTIYASVTTEGASPSASLTARWSYEDGQVVDETTESLSPSGPAVTEFHVSKPDGWPSGRYKVEIIADGKTAASRDFEVR